MDSDDVRKRLTFTSADSEQPLEVYLRVKPPETAVEETCVNITSNQTVEVRAPSSSLAYRNNTRRRRPATYKFSFTRVLPPTSTQTDMFRATCEPLIVTLISNMNSSLVFSFGVTNSGKTFTIEGTRQDAGILPRSLDVLFNSVGPWLMKETKFRPEKYNDIVEMDEHQSLLERTMLNELCSSSCMDVASVSCKTPSADTTTVGSNSTFSSDGHLSDFVNSLQQRCRETTCLDLSDAASQFSVFVSYVEIYNECLYDLLDVPPKKRQERRALPLSEDKSGNVYVKYLKRVNVMSADDALRAVALGRRNRHIVSTLFNEHSSRSHCMFTIYLIKMTAEKNSISQMSFVDLAGSERTPKASVEKTRLKETGNINKSLLTLKNCISTIRYNNNHKSNQRIIPYRESKLTRLLQNFFLNRGSISMIVNVSSNPDMFDETLHVLRFSATASQVRIAAPMNETEVLDDTLEDEDEEFDALLEEIENLREENLMLKREVRHGKSELQMQEMRLRDQFASESIKKIIEMDMCHQESIDAERIRMEEAEQRRLSLQGRMMTEAHLSEISILTSEIDELKQKLQSTQINVVDRQSMAKELSDKEEEVEKMTFQINCLEEELKILAKEKSDQVDALVADVNRLQTDLDDVNGLLLNRLDELMKTRQDLCELQESELKMRATVRDLNAQLNELEAERTKAVQAIASLKETVKQKEAEVEELQSHIHEMKNEQPEVTTNVTLDKEAQSQDVSHSLIVHDVETSLHSEIDVTPKAAKKKKKGRKRKTDENTELISKKQKLDFSSSQAVSHPKSRRAKKDAISKLAVAAEKVIPHSGKTSKQETRKKIGGLLFSTVFSPLAEKVRVALSPNSQVVDGDEKPHYHTRKKAKAFISKEEISWPIAFQGTTNKTIQGPSDRLLRSRKK